MDIAGTLRRTRPLLAAGLVATATGLSFGAPSPALSQDKVNFQWSWIPTGFYCPISGGIAKGFYTDVGIDLTVSTGRGSGDAVKKVAGGGAEVGGRY